MTQLRALCFLATLLVAALPTLPALAESDLLFGQVGTWRGTGIVSNPPGSAPQNIRCRLKATSDAPDTMEIRGRCAAAAGAARLAIRLETRADGTISAGVASPQLPETVQFSGVKSGDTISLMTRLPFEQDSQQYHSELRITAIGDTRFLLSEIRSPLNQAIDLGVLDLQFEFQGAGTTQ